MKNRNVIKCYDFRNQVTALSVRIIDMRTISPREIYASLSDALEVLKPGEALELISDHDPSTLGRRIAEENPDIFSWYYIETGPQKWIIHIKMAEGPDSMKNKAQSDDTDGLPFSPIH
jgi:uncharacterized protein (DUF2249 family)